MYTHPYTCVCIYVSHLTVRTMMVKLPSQHVQVGPSWASPPGNRMGLNLVSKWAPSGLAHL